MSFLPQWQVAREDWDYICTRPQYFRKSTSTSSPELELWELVIPKDEKDPGSQAAFYTFPESTHFESGDLFSKHPSKPNHYRFECRKDNVLILQADKTSIHNPSRTPSPPGPASLLRLWWDIWKNVSLFW